MIKRDIVETVYEYDQEGKLLKKTVTETHEEENNTKTNYPGWVYLNGDISSTSDSVTTNVIKPDPCVATLAADTNCTTTVQI